MEEKEKYPVIQPLRTSGNSFIVTIPMDFVKGQNLHKGDRIRFDLYRKNDTETKKLKKSEEFGLHIAPTMNSRLRINKERECSIGA